MKQNGKKCIFTHDITAHTQKKSQVSGFGNMRIYSSEFFLV